MYMHTYMLTHGHIHSNFHSHTHFHMCTQTQTVTNACAHKQPNLCSLSPCRLVAIAVPTLQSTNAEPQLPQPPRGTYLMTFSTFLQHQSKKVWLWSWFMSTFFDLSHCSTSAAKWGSTRQNQGPAWLVWYLSASLSCSLVPYWTIGAITIMQGWWESLRQHKQLGCFLPRQWIVNDMLLPLSLLPDEESKEEKQFGNSWAVVSSLQMSTCPCEPWLLVFSFSYFRKTFLFPSQTLSL